jgi:hypothetical protein
MIYLVCLIIYVLSAYLMWRELHKAFSINGRFSGLSPTIAEVVFVLIPGINTVALISYWIAFIKLPSWKGYKKFFKVNDV